MRIVAQMSSDILECLKFTWDSPECNAGGKMPVLDTQMWVSLESRERGLPEQIGQSVNVTKQLITHHMIESLTYLSKHIILSIFE